MNQPQSRSLADRLIEALESSYPSGDSKYPWELMLSEEERISLLGLLRAQRSETGPSVAAIDLLARVTNELARHIQNAYCGMGTDADLVKEAEEFVKAARGEGQG